MKTQQIKISSWRTFSSFLLVLVITNFKQVRQNVKDCAAWRKRKMIEKLENKWTQTKCYRILDTQHGRSRKCSMSMIKIATMQFKYVTVVSYIKNRKDKRGYKRSSFLINLILTFHHANIPKKTMEQTKRRGILRTALIYRRYLFAAVSPIQTVNKLP